MVFLQAPFQLPLYRCQVALLSSEQLELDVEGFFVSAEAAGLLQELGGIVEFARPPCSTPRLEISLGTQKPDFQAVLEPVLCGYKVALGNGLLGCSVLPKCPEM